MSIQNQIDRIIDKRNQALTKVASKGVTVPSGSTIDDLPGLIDLIDVLDTFTVTKTLTNVTTTNDDTKVIAGNSFHMDLSASSGLVFNIVRVTMGGVDITEQSFYPTRDYYSVTSLLSGGVSSNNDDVEVIAGDSFHMDLTPNNEKMIRSVTVTMGGVDVTSQVFTPGTGEKQITSNGAYNASDDWFSGYSKVTVNVPSGGGGSSPVLQSKSATPSETVQTITPDVGYDGLSSVEVGAISSTYVGTGIARKSSSDLTASGATVSVPAGYYAEAGSKSVASGTVSIPATSITANPSISINSAGLITATASASKSIAPSVSAGYVSSGTAGTVSVSGSNTEQLPTQAAATVTPATSSQTVGGAGKYMTGAITVNPIPSNYITTSDATASAADILSGETAYVNGSKLTGTLVIQHYYTGTSDPSAATGSNGDIYLKTGA